jgi:hypothetical protein
MPHREGYATTGVDGRSSSVFVWIGGAAVVWHGREVLQQAGVEGRITIGVTIGKEMQKPVWREVALPGPCGGSYDDRRQRE